VARQAVVKAFTAIPKKEEVKKGEEEVPIKEKVEKV